MTTLITLKKRTNPEFIFCDQRVPSKREHLGVILRMKEGGELSKPHRIILLGANGSGKSTLGRELARVLNFEHIDVEEYYFYQSDIPYTAMRPAEERNAMLLADMKKHGSFVMSGDVSGWGEEFLTVFDLVIFLTAPTDIRLKRIEKRENERWGDRVRESGDMYEQSQKFREFTASRDIPQLELRASLYACSILRVDSTKTLKENIDEILMYMKYSTAEEWEANQ